ncbi:MAG: hypothetical protein FWC46_02670 [Actinomycetia bacterium]|nr:hypothetical protein [Actinomycetes bacterium]
MNLILLAGRALFAAYFVVDGADRAGRTPEQLSSAQDTLDAWLPRLRRVVPPRLADRVPADAATWMKALGGLEIAAGVCYGLNVLPRPAAAVLAAASLPAAATGLLTSDPARGREAATHGLALLGAAIVATQEVPRPTLLRRLARASRAVTLPVRAPLHVVAIVRRAVPKAA